MNEIRSDLGGHLRLLIEVKDISQTQNLQSNRGPIQVSWNQALTKIVLLARA